MTAEHTVSETDACVALVARSVLDSDFLDRLSVEPHRAMAEMNVPVPLRPRLESLDTDRLRLVAAFVCKVKHNDLWEHLPVTRRMLCDRGVELAAFGAYAQTPRRSTDRVAEFVDFLANNLDRLGLTSSAIADVAQHELLVDRLLSATTDQIETDDVLTSAQSTSFPRHRGGIAIGAFWFDPELFVAGGDACAVSIDGLVPSDEPIFVCYSRPPREREVRMFRIDPATALVLTAVNGTRSVEEIAAEIDLVGANVSVVEAILTSAVERGVVEPFSTSRPITEASDESVLTLLEGYFATRVLYSMHRCGALAEIETPMSASSVARALDVDAVWLATALEFLALHTTLVQQLPDHRFQAAPVAYERLGFALDKFVGAYGPCLEYDGPTPDAVDGHHLAQAFERVTAERTALSSRPSTIATLVEQWHVAADVVDLGCGSGGVLVELAARNSSFRGIGVDQNAEMVAAGRRALVEFGLTGQVDILEGDAVAQLSSLPADRRRAVTAVHARSFFNACFGRGPVRAAEEVHALSGLFAGRLLFVDDYYGELGRQTASPLTPGWAVLQDIVQSWSGQGIPPGTREEWAEMYAWGGARLLHSYEDELDGFRRFIHVVRLGAEE